LIGSTTPASGVVERDTVHESRRIRCDSCAALHSTH
jgi:hypothetical protein